MRKGYKVFVASAIMEVALQHFNIQLPSVVEHVWEGIVAAALLYGCVENEPVPAYDPLVHNCSQESYDAHTGRSYNPAIHNCTREWFDSIAGRKYDSKIHPCSKEIYILLAKRDSDRF